MPSHQLHYLQEPNTVSDWAGSSACSSGLFPYPETNHQTLQLWVLEVQIFMNLTKLINSFTAAPEKLQLPEIKLQLQAAGTHITVT